MVTLSSGVRVISSPNISAVAPVKVMVLSSVKFRVAFKHISSSDNGRFTATLVPSFVTVAPLSKVSVSISPKSSDGISTPKSGRRD